MTEIPPKTPPETAPVTAASRQEGKLIALLLGLGYTLFALLPDSHSLMVLWPWVFVWQVVVMLPLLWFVWLLWYQRRWQPLGNGLDFGFGLVVVGIVISTLVAEFRPQAMWQSIAALGGLAAVYALTAWLRTPERRTQMWLFQGYLGVVFGGWSLLLWLTQTLWPELQRLRELAELEITANLDFSNIELRNWAPFGHQNYVAGYFLLLLPLLGSLAWQERGKRRWLWVTGLGLGVLGLYTTNSRGGWLGLATVTLVLGVALVISALKLGRQKRWVLGLGIGSLVVVLGLGWTTTRLRDSIWGLIQGNDTSELAYRWITSYVGWQMGATRPWSGTGLGSVPLLYQKFRPYWAGKEAEAVYQLHSTPAQIWAELGLWGLVGSLMLVAVLLYWGWRWRAWLPHLSLREQVLARGLGLGLLGYTIMAITDYQLDNLAITGLLAWEIACLAVLIRQGLAQESPARSVWIHGLGWLGFGLIIASAVWVWPIQQAWYNSSQGFNALTTKPPEWEKFVTKLDTAQAQAPWEPYYPLQLGWNLGWQSFQSSDPGQEKALLNQAIAAFRRGNSLAPNSEFGQSNLGWLLLRQDPIAAKFAFARALELMPTRPGVYYGLALSLLATNNPQLAQQSLVLEVLRQPISITSSLWQQPYLAPFYQPVLNQATQLYREWLNEFPANTPMGQYVRQAYAALVWWQADGTAINNLLETDLRQYLHPELIEVAEFHQAPTAPKPHLKNPQTPAQNLIAAWLDPVKRETHLAQAWLGATQSVIDPGLLEKLKTSMAQAPDFATWLRRFVPSQIVEIKRAGFGVLSRHIDGPQPSDFYFNGQNPVVNQILLPAWPTAYYLPPLDQTIEPTRQKLLTAVGQS